MSDKGYLFPTPIDPEEYQCYKVFIPKHALYIAAFWRSFEYLTTWHAWTKDTAHTAKDVAAIWKIAFELSRAAISEGGCEMPEFRINEETCLLEVNCSDDPEAPDWKPVFTPDYDPTSDAPPVILYPDPPPAGETNQCLAAENVTAFMKNGIGNMVGNIAAGGLLGTLAAVIVEFVAVIVDVVQANLWFTLLEVNWDDFNPATIEASYDAFDWDTFKNLIVCYFQSDGSMTPADHLEALDAMGAMTGEIWVLIRLIWSLIGSIGVSSAAAWGGITEGECEVCEGFWSHTWNEELGWEGWLAYNDDPNYGTLVDGVWVYGTGGGDDLLVVNSPVLAEEVLIDRMVWRYSVVGGDPPFGQHRINIFNDGGMNYNQAALDWSGGGHILDDTTPHNTIYAQFDIEAPPGYVAVQLTEVTFYGQGTDPYI